MRTPPHGNREPSPELARISPLVTRPPKPSKPPSTATSAVTSTPNTSKHTLNLLSNFQSEIATLNTTTTTTTQLQQHNQYNYNKGNNNNNNNNDHFHDIYDINNSKLFSINNDDNSSNSELYDRTNVSSPFKLSKTNISFYDGHNSNKSNEYIPTSLPPTPTPQTSFFQHQSGASSINSGGGGSSVGIGETTFNKEPVSPSPPPAPVTSIQPQGVVYAPQAHYQSAASATQPTVTTISAQNQSYLTMAINNRASSYIVSKDGWESLWVRCDYILVG